MTIAKSTPRRKRYKKQIRLIHAAEWIKNNPTKKNIIKRYAKWFGVSRLCAAQELILLGVTFDTDVISREKQLEVEKSNQRKKARDKRLKADNDSYDYHWNVGEEDGWIEYDEDVPF